MAEAETRVQGQGEDKQERTQQGWRLMTETEVGVRRQTHTGPVGDEYTSSASRASVCV